MKRTLLMAEIGQDNTWGKDGPGQRDRPAFCCRPGLEDEAGQEAQAPPHGGSGGSLMPGPGEGQGQQKAGESGFLEPAPSNPTSLAAGSGQDCWADHSPCRFSASGRGAGLLSSHLFSVREAAGMTAACPPPCPLQSLAHTWATAAARCPRLCPQG